MATLAITDPVTNAPHVARLKTATAAPTPEPPQETYDQLRERFLLRWCREKTSQSWCGTFDNIMVADLGYTAKAVLEARARFDYRHSAEVTLTSPHEIDKSQAKGLTDAIRRYLREYFSIENTTATTAELTMVSVPAPAEPELTELQAERVRVIKTILDGGFLGRLAERDMLRKLGYTDVEINDARTAGRWTYQISLNWHCQYRVNYPSDTKRQIHDRVMEFDRSFMVTDTQLTPGTTIELN